MEKEHSTNDMIKPEDCRVEKAIKPFHTISYIVPEIQRSINESAVIAIYDREKSYYNKYESYATPGTISIAICNGAEYLIDGQHRMLAYDRLSREDAHHTLMISIDYYHCSCVEVMESVYKLVNTCTPNDISRMGVDTFKIKREIEDFFKKQFGSYLKTTSKPVAPNISLDGLNAKLDSIDLTVFKFGEFVKYIIELNKFYSLCTQEQFKKWFVDTKAIGVIQQKENRMYIGLYRNYEWVDKIVRLHSLRNADPDCALTFASMEHMNIAHRVTIPKIVRKKVWNCDRTEQLCFCCKDTISYDNFESGHIISVAKGGLTTLTNLRPICSTCNMDMGTKNMDEYCKSIEDQLM